MIDPKIELKNLIDAVIRENGSDLHIAAGRHPALRVSGELIFLQKRSILKNEQVLEMLFEMVGEEKYDRFLKNQEIDFSYDFQNDYQSHSRLRGNAFYQRGLVSIALRLLPKMKTLAELRLPQVLETFAKKEQGFFLVVGPVGHGKSTTAAAIINLINNERTEHILIIEDPIEFIFEPKRSIIDQREVSVDTKDFNVALKSSFRQDVDVVMIGEMRSPDTISIAVTAAETGHLILSTLHTNNASQTIDRIIDSFPAGQQEQIRVQLASSLLGIFSQRLIPRISGGLVPAYELLINNKAISNLIREGRTHEIDVLIETGSSQGMVDLNRSLVELVRAGEITMENAIKYSLNPKGLERMS